MSWVEFTNGDGTKGSVHVHSIVGVIDTSKNEGNGVANTAILTEGPTFAFMEDYYEAMRKIRFISKEFQLVKDDGEELQ